MTDAYPSEITSVMESESLSLPAVLELRKNVYASKGLRRELDRLIEEYSSKLEKSPDNKAISVRKAVALWTVGETEEALAILEELRPRKKESYFLGRCCLETGRLAEAEKIFGSLAVGDDMDPLFASSLCEVLERSGRHAEAAKIAKKMAASFPTNPDGHYHLGFCCDVASDYTSAISHYNKAIELNSTHAPSIFRLAYIHELRGDEATALELYEKCISIPPVHVSALINLGLLYEDMGEYQKARDCYVRVLDSDPLNERARLFMADVEASLNMYYDEEQRKRKERWDQLLSTPITDFELSVRCRNCLQKMNVKTLGDLTKKTETELLAFDNFGKTSLEELRTLLAEKGLSLKAEKKDAIAQLFKDDSETTTRSPEDLRRQPLSSLNFSTRIVKCLSNSKLRTLGDLQEMSEQELLAIDNFGQISLQELKHKLHGMGLALKNESENPETIVENVQ